MDRFVVLYWLGAFVLVVSSIINIFSEISLITLAISGIIGLAAMITAVIDFNIRKNYKQMEFRHIITSEIAFWIGLFVAFLSFIIKFEMLFLGLAIMIMSVLDFLLTERKRGKTIFENSWYNNLKKRKVGVYRLYSATWFISLILIISSLLNNKWVTFGIGTLSLILSFLGYEMTRLEKAVSKEKYLLKQKNYIFYSLTWFGSAGLMLLAFINQMYITFLVAYGINLLSSLGYGLNRPKINKLPLAAQKAEKKTFILTMEFLFFLGFFIIVGGFGLYQFKLINIEILSIVSLAGIITVIAPLLSFKRFKKKHPLPNVIYKKAEKKVSPVKKNYLFSLEIAYLIGSGLIVLGFILFQQSKISLRGLTIILVFGLLTGIITSLIVNSKMHKKGKDIYVNREKLIRVYRLKLFKKISETQFDDLYNMVDSVGIVKVSEVSKKFGISKQLAEEWGKILEGHKLIMLHYPAFGELEFKKWKK